MEVVGLIREFQNFDPETGRFNKFREARQYAALLGVSPSRLCRYYQGQRRPSADLVLGFLRAFPDHSFDALRAWMAEREVA